MDIMMSSLKWNLGVFEKNIQQFRKYFFVKALSAEVQFGNAWYFWDEKTKFFIILMA